MTHNKKLMNCQPKPQAWIKGMKKQNLRLATTLQSVVKKAAKRILNRPCCYQLLIYKFQFNTAWGRVNTSLGYCICPKRTRTSFYSGGCLYARDGSKI